MGRSCVIVIDISLGLWKTLLCSGRQPLPGSEAEMRRHWRLPRKIPGVGMAMMTHVPCHLSPHCFFRLVAENSSSGRKVARTSKATSALCRLVLRRLRNADAEGAAEYTGARIETLAGAAPSGTSSVAPHAGASFCETGDCHQMKSYGLFPKSIKGSRTGRRNGAEGLRGSALPPRCAFRR